MKLFIFCVRDSATSMFGTPMFLAAKGQAIRSFSDEVNRSDKDNQLYRHPQDFALFELGSWDSDSGKFECVDPVQVVRGQDVRIKE